MPPNAPYRYRDTENKGPGKSDQVVRRRRALFGSQPFRGKAMAMEIPLRRGRETPFPWDLSRCQLKGRPGTAWGRPEATCGRDRPRSRPQGGKVGQGRFRVL